MYILDICTNIVQGLMNKCYICSYSVSGKSIRYSVICECHLWFVTKIATVSYTLVFSVFLNLPHLNFYLVFSFI